LKQFLTFTPAVIGGRPLCVFRAAAIVLVVLMCSAGSFAYSVLTHEEIVDLLWTNQIRSLLLQRYPGLTEDQIREAHAYAYGGSVIQDLGYYPFGNREFSNLVHYVRSGDFVSELIAQSQDANEYAFALGALSHYASDIAGHPAVNQSVAIAYPKLRAKFGKSVRYAQDTTAHLKTEFGFDTLQVAKNRYAPMHYHDFIGFEVSEPLLERVFPIVYGLELKDVLKNEDMAVGSYRFFVSSLIPRMTQVALQTHKKDLMRETPNFARQKFLYRLSRSDYEREWGKTYTRPCSSDSFQRSARSRDSGSTTQLRKPKIYISKASMQPPITTTRFLKQCGHTSWFCPTAISTAAKQPKQRNTRWRMNRMPACSHSCRNGNSI
jgi:hypothetical protein